jgi:AcrR family transcriptional regulator
MIQSAALLFRERGIEGTAFADVLDHSGAPLGSVYHHFPGGKQQLAEEATRYAGEFIAMGLAAALQTHDPLTALDTFVKTWIRVLRDSNYEAGCPIVAAALEGDRSPAARDAAAEAFARWEHLIAEAFARHGVTRDRAQPLATLILASIEGAIVLARAQRTSAPLERVAREVQALAKTNIRAHAREPRAERDPDPHLHGCHVSGAAPSGKGARGQRGSRHAPPGAAGRRNNALDRQRSPAAR